MSFLVEIKPASEHSTAAHLYSSKEQSLSTYRSASDSGAWWATSKGSRKHGLDIEKLGKRHQAFGKLVVTSRELRVLAAVVPRSQAVIWAWSIKEACYKCADSGYEPADFIVYDYQHSSFLVQAAKQRFQVVISRGLDGYALCLALVLAANSEIIDCNEERRALESIAAII